jgi:hypothetical protein
LKPYTGSTTISASNVVLDGYQFGALTITGKNVTIKNSVISAGSGSDFAITTKSGGSFTLTDSEVVGGSNGIGFDNWTGIRINVHGQTDDGMKLGSNVRLEDSWIHGLTPGSGAHADGGQVQSGITNTVIRHNVIDVGTGTRNANAALFLAPDLGPSTAGPLLIESNWLNGGNYIVQIVDGDNGRYFIGNITFRNNRFGSTYAYGALRTNVPVTMSGNVWDATGKPIS